MGDPDREAKRAAARRAVDDHVKDGMVVGVGTGSTAFFVVERLAELVKEKAWKLTCVPTSSGSKRNLESHQLTLGSLEDHPVLDVAIDGADECDANLHLIKGGGGALTQEKIVAHNAKLFVVVAQQAKRSQVLGSVWKQGVPVEVLALARACLVLNFEQLGGKAVVRTAPGSAEPVVTDNGNILLDVNFGEIADPARLAHQMAQLPGVVEHGLFVGMCDHAYFGDNDGSVVVVDRKRSDESGGWSCCGRARD